MPLSDDAERILKTVYYIGILNFVLFIALGFYFGGDAYSGRVEDGRYYLRSHGRFTEVSPVVFGYSKLHFASQIITFPLALVSSILLHSSRREA